MCVTARFMGRDQRQQPRGRAVLCVGTEPQGTLVSPRDQPWGSNTQPCSLGHLQQGSASCTPQAPCPRAWLCRMLPTPKATLELHQPSEHPEPAPHRRVLASPPLPTLQSAGADTQSQWFPQRRAVWGSPQATTARRAHGSPLPRALGAATPDGLRREAPSHAGTRRGRPARGRAQPGADAFCRLQAQNGADAGAGVPAGRGERREEPSLVPGGGWGSLTPTGP